MQKENLVGQVVAKAVRKVAVVDNSMSWLS